MLTRKPHSTILCCGVLEDRKDQALVCVINDKLTGGNGYLLGLATHNEYGYTPLNMILEEHDYRIAEKWVDEANEIIYKRNAKETYKIVLSSLKFQRYEYEN